MSNKRFFGFADFADWVAVKVDAMLTTLTQSLESVVRKDDDMGQYKVGEVELAVLLADLASGADLETLQSGFNDFVAAKASAAEAIAGTDDAKYLTAVGAKAAIDQAVNDLVGSAPEAMNTIVELATALENNPDIISNLTTLVGQKLDATATAANSTLFEGRTKAQVVAEAVTAAETALADDLAGKLGVTATAADSAKLEGRTKAQVIADTTTALALGTASKSNLFVSTVDPQPADGKDGDLWIKYTP